MTDNLSKSLKSTEHELSWANRGLKGNNVDDGNHSFFHLNQMKTSVLFFL